MVLPGHLAGGYLATSAFLAVAPIAALSPTQTTAILVIGTLFGDSPDIDLLWFYIQKKFNKSSDKSHRDYITHTPIFWLIVSLIVVTIGLLDNSEFIQYIGWAVLCGSWSHFILDTIEYGIRWLWPFSNQRFTLRQVPEVLIENEIPGTPSYYVKYLKNVYIKRISFYLEILIVLIALFVIFK